MEVKAGCKQTDVGIIPEDWDVKSLGELASVTAGGTPSRSNPQFWDGDIPWITTTEVDFNIINHAEQFITKEGLNRSAAKLLPPGTLLMALYGQGKTRGKVAVLGIEAATNQACAAITLNRNVSGNFIFRFLISQYKAIRNLSNTGNQENLNSSLVRSIPIVLPSPDEQEAITEALSDADALIEALEVLIAKKRQIKQGAMQEFLTGKSRLPGFSGDWQWKTIGEIGNKFLNGGTPSTKKVEYWEGIIPWITGADIIDQKVVDVVRRFITDEAVKNSSTNIVEKGNLLVVTRTGVGKIAIAPFDLAISQDLTGVYVNREYVLPEFLYWYFSYNTGSLRNLNQGTSIAGITRYTLMSLSISLPSIPEQTAITEVLSDIDAEITALEGKLAKARQVKQGMMSELLTGRVRLV